MVSEHK